MDYRILRPLEVINGGQRLRFGGVKRRAVRAILLNAKGVVSVDRLVDGLWGERPPGSVIGTLDAFISTRASFWSRMSWLHDTALAASEGGR